LNMYMIYIELRAFKKRTTIKTNACTQPKERLDAAMLNITFLVVTGFVLNAFHRIGLKKKFFACLQN